MWNWQVSARCGVWNFLHCSETLPQPTKKKPCKVNSARSILGPSQEKWGHSKHATQLRMWNQAHFLPWHAEEISIQSCSKQIYVIKWNSLSERKREICSVTVLSLLAKSASWQTRVVFNRVSSQQWDKGPTVFNYHIISCVLSFHMHQNTVILRPLVMKAGLLNCATRFIQLLPSLCETWFPVPYSGTMLAFMSLYLWLH